MSIRFTCLSCRTVLKIGEMVTEPRKVRCTGCSIVILVEPDPANPSQIKTSIPEQNLNKSKSRSDKALARQKNLLLAAAALVFIGSLGGLWWTFWPSENRAAIEGLVKLDGDPLERGVITFISQDGKNVNTSALINQGRYLLSANNGPAIGKNKVEIRSEKKTGRSIQKPGAPAGDPIPEVVEAIAERFNAKSQLIIDVKPGPNTKDFDVKAN